MAGKEISVADAELKGLVAELLSAPDGGKLLSLLFPSLRVEEEEDAEYAYVLEELLSCDGKRIHGDDEEAKTRILRQLRLEDDPNVIVRVVDQRHLKPIRLDPNTRVLLLRSGCGTGKSDAICRLLTEKAQAERVRGVWKGVLAVSDRETLAQALHQRFSEDRYHGWRKGRPDPKEEVGMAFYQELGRDEWLRAESIATTYNSLWKTHPIGSSEMMPRRAISVYLKDEMESGQEYLMTATTFHHLQSGRRVALAADRWHISSASLIVAADKDLSDISCGYIRQILPTAQIEIIENTHRTNGNHLLAAFRTCINFAQDAAWVCHLMLACDLVQKGKRLFMVFTAKTELDHVDLLLRERFPDTKMLFISSDSSHKDRLSWKDVNTLWADYSVVAITPTITTGVDYNPSEKKHLFDYALVFAKESSVIARTLCQMVLRVRRLTSDKVFALLPRPGHEGRFYPEGEEELRRITEEEVANSLPARCLLTCSRCWRWCTTAKVGCCTMWKTLRPSIFCAHKRRGPSRRTISPGCSFAIGSRAEGGFLSGKRNLIVERLLMTITTMMMMVIREQTKIKVRGGRGGEKNLPPSDNLFAFPKKESILVEPRQKRKRVDVEEEGSNGDHAEEEDLDDEEDNGSEEDDESFDAELSKEPEKTDSRCPSIFTKPNADRERYYTRLKPKYRRELRSDLSGSYWKD